MDIKERQARIKQLDDEIKMLSRYDQRNQRVKRQLEEKLHSAKLRKAGEVLETAGILDTYDAEEVLRLHTAHKAEILKTDRSDRNGKYEQIADPHSEER